MAAPSTPRPSRRWSRPAATSTSPTGKARRRCSTPAAAAMSRWRGSWRTPVRASESRAQGEGNQRHLFACLLALLLVAAFAPAQAQTYPNRPVKIVVPTVAGGVVDVVTRLLAQQLAARLGQ